MSICMSKKVRFQIIEVIRAYVISQIDLLLIHLYDEEFDFTSCFFSLANFLSRSDIAYREYIDIDGRITILSFFCNCLYGHISCCVVQCFNQDSIYRRVCLGRLKHIVINLPADNPSSFSFVDMADWQSMVDDFVNTDFEQDVLVAESSSNCVSK